MRLRLYLPIPEEIRRADEASQPFFGVLATHVNELVTLLVINTMAPESHEKVDDDGIGSRFR